MLQVQLDLFKTQEESELDALKEAFAKVQKSCDAVRRKLFAENGELKKKVLDLESRLAILESNICKGKYEFYMDKTRAAEFFIREKEPVQKFSETRQLAM